MVSRCMKLALASYLLIVCAHLIASAAFKLEEEVFAIEGEPLKPENTKRLLEQLANNIDKVSWPRRDFVRLLIEAGELSRDKCDAKGFKSIKSLSDFSSRHNYIHLNAYLGHFEAAKFELCADSLAANLAHLVEHDVSAEDKAKLAAFKERVLANLDANLDESAPADVSKALSVTLRAAAEEKFNDRGELDEEREDELDEFFEQLVGGSCRRVRRALKPVADVYNVLSRPLFEACADKLAKEWIFNENLCHEMLHGPYDPVAQKRPGCLHLEVE